MSKRAWSNTFYGRWGYLGRIKKSEFLDILTCPVCSRPHTPQDITAREELHMERHLRRELRLSDSGSPRACQVRDLSSIPSSRTIMLTIKSSEAAALQETRA